MPLPRPPANTISVTMEYDQAGRLAENTFWLQTSGGLDDVTGSDLSALSVNLAGTWEDNVMPLLSTGVSLARIRFLLYATSHELEEVSSLGLPGGSASEPLSAQAAGVVSFNIARIYRGGKPRIYLPGMVTSDMAPPRNFNAPAITRFNTAMNQVLADVAAFAMPAFPGLAMGVLSRVLAGVPRTPPVFFPYLGAGFQSRICTQKRRLGREV